MKINAVIFDLDGTLVDSMGIWFDVDKEFLAKRNIIPPKDLFQDIKGGNNFVETAQYFKEKFNLSETIEEIMNEWTQMVAEHYKNSVKTKDGVLEVLYYLQEMNIKMAVGTSNSEYLSKTVLSSNNIDKFFKAIVSGNDKIKGKPFPDIFLTAAKLIHEKPENCIVIEDTVSGVEAAKNAKMKVCAIYDKHSETKINLIKEKADWFVYDFFEMKNFFSKILSDNR